MNKNKIQQRTLRATITACALVTAFLFSTPVSTAQSLLISRSPDFSSADNLFSFDDVLYVKVVDHHIDYTDLKKSEWQLHAEHGSEADEVKGTLDNNWDGSYTAAVSLAGLDRAFSQWRLRVRVEDRRKNKYERTAYLTISESGTAIGDLVVEGVVVAVESSRLAVGGVQVQVQPDIPVEENHQPIPYSAIEPGWQVLVFAQGQTDQTLVGKKIIVEARSSALVEIEGPISVKTQNSIFISSVEFVVDEDTEIRTKSGQDLTFSQLQVGQKVKAEGEPQGRARAHAVGIRVVDSRSDNREVEIFGELQSVHADGNFPDSLRLFDQSYVIDAQTEVIGFQGEQISVNDLQPGEELRLKARTRAGQAPLLKKVERYLNVNFDLSVSGTVESVAGDGITVNGLGVGLQENTVVLGPNREFLSTAALGPGMEVQVYAEGDGDRIFADTIILLSATVPEDVITEAIRDIGDNWFQIGDFRFLLDESTRYLDLVGEEVGRDHFQVGDRVEARGVAVGENQYRASQVQQIGPKLHEIAWQGPIKDRSETRLKIEGREFDITGATRWYLADGTPAPDLNAFVAGKIVEVLAQQTGEKWLARSVTLTDRVDEEIEIEGPVETAGAGMLRLLGQEIRLTEASELRDENGAPLQPGDLRSGDWVQARTKIVANGRLFGWRITRLQPAQQQSVLLEGPVARVTSDRVEMNGLPLLVDGNTQVLDPQGAVVSLNAIGAGLVVRVDAQKIGSLLLAREIRLLSRVQLAGVVQSVNSGMTRLANSDYLLAEDVLVLNESGAPIQVSQLQEGHEVQSVAELTGGQPVLTRLQILGKRNITAVEEQNERSAVPGDFALSPSFPNPIRVDRIAARGNSIVYELAQPARVSLTVYNLLGQKVRDLIVGEVRPAGRFTAVWNGRDSRGRVVAPGVYFYRLVAGKRRYVRQVTVLP